MNFQFNELTEQVEEAGVAPKEISREQLVAIKDSYSMTLAEMNSRLAIDEGHILDQAATIAELDALIAQVDAAAP